MAASDILRRSLVLVLVRMRQRAWETDMVQLASALTLNDIPPDIEEEQPLDGTTETSVDCAYLADLISKVLDLPQLYQKPAAGLLLRTLTDLSSAPPSWEESPRMGTPQPTSRGLSIHGQQQPFKRKRKIKSEGIPDYLTRIISSPLSWIKSNEEKEQIWETASQRLSERSGRTAMGAINRTFVIPVHKGTSVPEIGPYGNIAGTMGTSGDEVVELALHEPALTADNLGLKTWASSYLLAKRLCTMRQSLTHMMSPLTILELGAGTGLVGLAAAAVFSTHVVLTDLPEIVPNLERNILANTISIGTHSGSAEAAVLDWSKPSDLRSSNGDQVQPHSFQLIVAADPIYTADHPELFVNAVSQHLTKSENARVVIELPLREAYVAERQNLRARMVAAGLTNFEEGEEVGYDDWSANGRDNEELTEVHCWWSIWGRKASD